MKKTLFLIGAGLLTAAIQSYAIEGLTVHRQGGNAVLSWPSSSATTYIVQYRDAFDSSHPWQTLSTVQGLSGTTTYSDQMTFPKVSQSSQTMASTTALSTTDTTTTDSGSVTNTRPMPPMPPGLILNDDGSVTVAPARSLSTMIAAASASGAPLPGTPPQGGGITTPPTYRFYRVMENGIHVFGLTNGIVVSGTIPLPLEYVLANTSQAFTLLYLTTSDYPTGIPGSCFTDPANAFWDTTSVANGTYTVSMGAMLNDGTSISAAPVTITVSNPISFLDDYSVAGEAMYVGAKTIYPSGSYEIDFYNDQGTYIGYFSGSIDQNGYLTCPGNNQPDGFSIAMTDANGNPLPYDFIDAVYNIYPPGVTPQGSIHPLVNLVYPKLTKRVSLEKSWNYATKAVVAYMGMFSTSQTVGWDDVQNLMNHIYGVENIWHTVIEYRDYNPTLSSTTDWDTLLTNLKNESIRDFVYLGHGSGSCLGDDNPTRIFNSGWGFLTTNVQQTLLNARLDGSTTYSKHPYRFVFLDGCSTAGGDWPLVFCIPKKTMTTSNFVNKRGIRPRAFVGWSHDKALSTDGTFQNPSVFEDHAKYVQAIWDAWNPGPGNTPTVTIKQAIENAKKVFTPGLPGTNPYDGITLCGATDLMIDK